MVYRDRGYFGAKTKGYDSTMKRVVKGHTLGIKDILEIRALARKEPQGKKFIQ